MLSVAIERAGYRMQCDTWERILAMPVFKKIK